MSTSTPDHDHDDDVILQAVAAEVRSLGIHAVLGVEPDGRVIYATHTLRMAQQIIDIVRAGLPTKAEAEEALFDYWNAPVPADEVSLEDRPVELARFDAQQQIKVLEGLGCFREE